MNLIYITMSLALLCLVPVEAGLKAQLEQLCRLEKKAPEVTMISEVRSMIDRLRVDQSIDCAPQFREAIMALEPVIELESVCSEQAADTIVDFWIKYLDKNSKLKESLPKTLKKFYIGFGLQVSRVCRHTLVEQLEQASKEKGITEQDINDVTKTVKRSGKIKVLFNGDMKLENLVFAVRTDASKDAHGNPKYEKVRVGMSPLKRYLFLESQEICSSKFKHIYNSLISPIVRLAAIGLSSGDIGEFKQTKIYQDWFSVVFACESFVNHVPVVIPPQNYNNIDFDMVTILGDKDLIELRKRTDVHLDEPVYEEPANYKVQVQIDDLVLEPKLASSIKGYGKGLNNITKLKLGMMKRLPTVLKYLNENKHKVKVGLNNHEEIYEYGKGLSLGSLGDLLFGTSQWPQHWWPDLQPKWLRSLALLIQWDLFLPLVSLQS